MTCPFCQEINPDDAEACFTCGKALHALTQGAVLASRYVIRQLLGKGGMGQVYRAFDRMLEEDVAIKVIRGELMRDVEMAHRFRSEIRLARKVSHANVCRIHEYGESGGLRFLSMEFVEGVDLKRLARDGRLSAADGFEVAIQAAEGLKAVHSHGIIHRDLKPANIMVDHRGVVRLMDFGIAKEAEAVARLTGSGQLMGTPEYMSPEQASGKVGYASDVYALGCMVYEVFTGEPPFRADTPLNTLYMHLHNAPPIQDPDGRLPAGLGRVLRKALAKEPGDRYTATALVAALREAQQAEGLVPGDLAARVAGVAGVVSLRAGGHLVGSGTAADQPFQVNAAGAMVTTTLGAAGSVHTAGSHRTARESRRLRWGFAALSLAAGIVVLAGNLRSRPPVEPSPQPSPAALGGSAPTDALLLAPPPIAAVDVPAPVPATAATQPPTPSRTVRPGPSSSPPPAPSLPLATPSVPAPAAPAQGTLSLVIVPPAEVTIDGESLGTVSLREILLPPGGHVVRILHPDYRPLQRKVTIEPGLTERLVLDLGEKGVRRPHPSDPPR